MWRARGLRPGRGARCCSSRRVIVRRALKSQVHDGCVSADSSSCHVDQARNSLALQVSIQQLSPLPSERQHVLSLAGPISPGDGVEHPALGFPERPAAGNTNDCGCDCSPSTSASTSGALVDSRTSNGRWRGVNSRDAAALTRRITRTQSTPELQAVVEKYRTQLNPIHVAAAIVKLAKLTAAESGRRRARRGLASPYGQHTWRGGWDNQRPLPVRLPGTAADDVVGAEPDALGSGIANAPAPHADHSVQALTVDVPLLAPVNGHAPSAEKDSSSSSPSGLRAGLGNIDEDSAGGSGLSEPIGGGRGTGEPGHTFGCDRPGVSAGPLEAQGDPQQRPRCELPSRSSSSAGLLLADLVPGFLSQLPHYSARQFANVVWALGSMGSREHPEVLHAAATQLQAHNGAKLLAAQPQELSNLALGLAKLGYREVPLWAAIIAAGKRRLHEFKPQELHNMAWAVASASQDRSMISAAVQAALPQLRSFNASGLANLLWACAAAQCPCEELFDAAATVLMALPPEGLNCQDVANTAWACAKLQHSHPQLMAHLARVVLAAKAPAGGPGGPSLRSATTQELVNMLWAFAVLPLPLSLKVQQADVAGVGGGGQAAEVLGGVGGQAEGAVGRGGVTRDGREDRGLVERQAAEPWQSVWLPGLQSDGTSSASESGRSGLSNLPAHRPQARGRDGSVGSSSSSGLAQTGGGDGSLLEGVVRALLLELSRRTDISPQGASNALWACACLQPCPLPAAALTCLLDVAIRCAPRMSDQEVSNTLWAVAQLCGAGVHVPYASLEPVFAVACCSARLETMAPAALAQLVHAAVALRQVPTPHMDLLAQQVMARLPVLGPQELCVLAVAVAEAVRVCRYCNPILLNGLANAAVACVAEMCPQAITTLLWSFARAKHYHGPLTTALCRAAKPRLRDFNDLELSNLVCALAVLKCQDRQLLVQAARVLVERVRLRRQRRAMAAAVRRMQDRPQQQQQQLQHQHHHLSGALLEHAVGEQDGDEDELWWGQGQLHSEEREDVELAWASQRQQQQQRRRRRQQEQQQQQRQSEEADLAGSQRGAMDERPPQGSTAAPAAGDALGPVAAVAWRGEPWDGAEESHGSALPAFEGSDLVPADASSRAEQSAKALTATVNGRPVRAPDTEVSPLTHPEAQLRLRRLPYMHSHHDSSADADAPLQPRRPPARELWGEAAGSGRRGGGGTGSSSSSTLSSMDSIPSAAPRCMGVSDAASGLAQRSVSSMDDGDADLPASSARASSGGSNAAAAADPSTPRDHAKSMSKLLWSYAKCNLYNQSLFKLLTQELQPVLRHTSPHELTLSLWAVACHGHRCPDFLDAAAGLLLRGRVRDLCPWDGSVVAWAFAKLGHKHWALFEALQQQARAAGPRYKEPNLLRLAWACAAVEVPLHEDLLRRVVAVKQQGRRRVVYSSYDGADGEVRAEADAARAEVEW